MCLKRPITAAFGSSEPFYMEKWACYVTVPSLHREFTDSLITLPGRGR